MSPQGAVSAKEQRFDQLRAKLGLVAAPFVLLLIWLWPGGDAGDPVRQMAAITCFTVLLWVSEAVPLAVAALVGPCLAVVFGIETPAKALAPFAHPLIFLFIGGLIIALALAHHGVDRRVALWIISRPIVGGRPKRALIAVCVTTFLLSMWLSNTATTAMMLPVALGLCRSIADQLGPEDQTMMGRFQEGLLIAMAYAASLGGMSTPVGTAPNMIAVAALETQLGVHIDFVQWMGFGVPIAVAGLLLVLGVALVRCPAPDVGGATTQSHLRAELDRLGPVRPAESRAILVFLVAVLGWLTPALFRLGLGETHAWTQWARGNLKEGVVAILAAALLFIVPQGQRTGSDNAREETPGSTDPGAPLLDWKTAQNIDWGTILLLGGGIALGKLIFGSGLAQAIGTWAIGGDGSNGDPVSATGLLLAASGLVILLTEFTSNTATTNMMLPVLIPIATASGFDATPVALSVCLAASFAFMLPVSTPPNAIVYGSGRIRLPAMVSFGAWMDLLGFLLLAAFGTLVLPQLSF